MTHFCPAYPKPRVRKASAWRMFFSARRSWLDALYERSYSMQVGEVHLPGVNLYMVNKPSLVKRILETDSEAFPKSKLLGRALKPLLGESIFTTSGKQWRKQRQMMDPAFAQTRLTAAYPQMAAAVQDMLLRLSDLPDGAEYDFEAEMTHVTADIIFRTIFSSSLQSSDARRIFFAFARYQAIAPRLLLPSIYNLSWLVWPWDIWNSRQAAAEIRGLLADFIRPRYLSYTKGEPQDCNDILQSFIQARSAETGEGFSFDELVDQVAMLFLAGHETSASALTWAVYMLANSRDIQERMHLEVTQQLQQRKPDASDIRYFSLTRNVFKEALRLFPPVGFMARQSSYVCPMDDKVLEKNDTVVVSPWLIHRHRLAWMNPDAFNPDRFDEEASKQALKDAYLPFGMGPRVCLGAAFALQEATLILASLVRDYSFLPVAGHEPQPVGRLTIRSANGVRLTLHKRRLAA